MVVALSIWNAPVPPVAMVNGFELAVVAPVYCSVPVVPLPPKVTAVALLPSVPATLALLMVLTASVPCCTFKAPVKVFAPEMVSVPVPVLVSEESPPPLLAMTLEMVMSLLAVLTTSSLVAPMVTVLVPIVQRPLPAFRRPLTVKLVAPGAVVPAPPV